MTSPQTVDDPHLRFISSGQNDATLFASALTGQVNREDIASMVYVQRDMLSRFEKTNEMLINFNILSTGRYEATLKDFQKHTQLLYDMKKDLDSVFKRIRVLKQRLDKTYPEAFAACSSVSTLISDDDEEDDEDDSDENLIPVNFQQENGKAKPNNEPLSSQTGARNPPLVTVTAGSPPHQESQKLKDKSEKS